MTTIQVNCPLCEWHYEVKPLDPRIDVNTLAGVFGHGVVANIAINRQNEATEAALDAHLKTHTLVEWVRKVSSLETEIRLLKSAFA